MANRGNRTGDNAADSLPLPRWRGSQWKRVHRLHGALESAIRPEDLYSIILTAAIAEEGLGFDRAFLYVYNDREGIYQGVRAVGALTLARHRELRGLARRESRALGRRLRDCLTPDASPRESDLAHSLQQMAEAAFWFDNVQLYQNETELERRFLGSVCRCDWRHFSEECQWCLCRAVQSGQTLALPERGGIRPPFLNQEVSRPAWVAPLRTKKGPRAVLVADAPFTGARAATKERAELFSWFADQAALALEHCELFGDLESAYSQLQEIETLKSNFLSTISHELRSPLTGILGFAQILLSGKTGPLDDRRSELLQKIQHEAQSLNAKVNDLLEIAESDLHPGAMLDVETVDAAAAVRSVIPRLEYRRKAKNARILPQIPRDLPPIRANRDALERVLFHLLDNAVKFAPPEGRVFVDVRRRDEWLRIEVADNGIGISPGNLHRIFDSFYQVDNRLSRSYEGLGIGLSVTKRLLEAMGGRIDVQSHVGQGSRFSLEFPLALEMREHRDDRNPTE